MNYGGFGAAVARHRFAAVNWRTIMADSPKPPAPPPPPAVVIRSNQPEDLEVQINNAIFHGYEPEPGLMCCRGNEVWLVCLLREDDDPRDQGDNHAKPEPAPSKDGHTGNVNEAAAQS